MPKVKKTAAGLRTATDEDIRRIAAHFAAERDDDGAYMYGDDEEIDEDEAFDAQDEKRWGSIVNPIVKRTKGFADVKGSQGAGHAKRVAGAASDSDDDPDLSDGHDGLHGGSGSASEDLSEADHEGPGDDEDDGATEDEDSSDAEEGSSDEHDGEDDDDDDEDDDDAVMLTDIFDLNASRQGAKAGAKTRVRPGAASDEAEETDEDEDDEEDEDADGGGDDEDLTEEQQQRLLEYIQQLDGHVDDATQRASKRPRIREQVAEGPEHEFGTKVAGGALSLSDLMGSLSGSAQFGALKERLERLTAPTVGGTGRKRGRKEMEAGPLAAPASKAVQARADRATAYEEVSQHVSRWTDLVQINRQAPHLSFSAEAQGAVGDRARGLTTSALAADFRPTNELEAAIAEALASGGVNRSAALSDSAVRMAERAELELIARTGGAADTEMEGDGLPAADFDAEGYERRQRELAKMRALLFYDEIKRRRQNKIKSKAYRRLKSRVDAKRGAAEREELRKRDPAAAAKLDEAEAKILAKERMTLKHRAGKGIGGSKWVKRVLSQGGGGGNVDAATKQAMLEHLKRAQELQQRMRDAKERAGSDSEVDSDGDLPMDAAPADMLAAARKRILADVGISEDGGEATLAASAADADGKYVFNAGGAQPKQGGKDADVGKGIMGMRFMVNAATRAREQARQEALLAASELEHKEKLLRGKAGKRGVPKDDFLSSGDEVGSDEGRDLPANDDDDADERASDGQFDPSAVALDDGGDVERKGKRSKGAKSTPAGSGSAPTAAGRRAYTGPDSTTPGRVKSRATKSDQAKVDALLENHGGAAAPAAKVATSEPLQVAQAPHETRRNAWLTQGGVTLGDMTAAPKEASKEAAASSSQAENPWLADNTFNSGATSSGNAATAVATSRHGATRRAQSAVAGAPESAALDIAAGLSLLEKATATAKSHGKHPEKDAQAELIRRAFAGVGATAEELIAEKDEDEQERAAAAEGKKAAKGRSQEEMATSAGWGTWAGLGARPVAEQLADEAKKKRRAGSKLAAAIVQQKVAKPVLPQRRDAGLSTVIISEKRDKKLATHFQVPTVPHPFQTKEQYERSLRQPVGPEWNTAATVTEMTAPEVVSRAGVIIQPIQYTKVKKGNALKTAGGTREQASAVASAHISKDRRR